MKNKYDIHISGIWNACCEVYVHTYFLEIASLTEEAENVCSWTYLLKNNKVQQIVKFMVSNTSHTHVCDLSRPGKLFKKQAFMNHNFLYTRFCEHKTKSVTYLELSWADRYTHQTHKGATMIITKGINFQNLYLQIL